MYNHRLQYVLLFLFSTARAFPSELMSDDYIVPNSPDSEPMVVEQGATFDLIAAIGVERKLYGIPGLPHVPGIPHIPGLQEMGSDKNTSETHDGIPGLPHIPGIPHILGLPGIGGATVNATLNGQLLVRGILIGTGRQEFPDAEDCLTNEQMEQVYAYVESTMAQFKSGGSFVADIMRVLTLAQFRHIFAGTRDMGKAFQLISGAINDPSCQATAKEAQNFANSVSAYASPVSAAVHLGGNILMNGKDVTEDLKAMYTACSAKEYEPCGEQMGRILASIAG